MIQFIKQFIKHPTKIGAILPSSGYLARRMVEDIDLQVIDIETMMSYLIN